MFRLFCSLLAAGAFSHTLVNAQDLQGKRIPSIEAIFAVPEDKPVVHPIAFYEKQPVPLVPGSAPASEDAFKSTFSCDMGPGSMERCVPVLGSCDSLDCNNAAGGWFLNDLSVLECLKNQEIGDWTYSLGGELRYRFLDESNRLRPPVAGRNSSYNQWRFSPYLEVKHGDDFTGLVQAIDAPTFDHDLPQLPIDENRFDLLQYYADFKLFDSGEGEKFRLKVGRQFLLYDSQHLVSPLAWANTYRNFEGVKLTYACADWNVDAFATRPVNGATGNAYRPTSYDTPDQSRWFSGVYTTYKKAPKGTMDFYWLWLDEDEDRPDRIDGNRHTFGMRYAGKHLVKDSCGDQWLTLTWDWEGAFQVGRDVVVAGPSQDVLAGFFSSTNGATFNQVPWSPTVSGIFYWGSGDDDPTDGTQHTVSTLFPLGHAYWGLIDNFSGQNLIDFSPQLSVKPTEKLTLLTAVHWFQKAQAEDAIWNIAGAPFGGVTTTNSRFLGTEVDLVGTYAVNKNLSLQAGYFWFFYGGAVNQHPNAAVANRDDAEQFYFMADWKF